MPTLCIEPLVVTDFPQLHHDLILFISANAVRYGLPILQQRGEGCLARVRMGAVGRQTASCLQQAGFPPDLMPEHFNSEGLLALPELQEMAGKHVLIVRGQGGREMLADGLRQRGATVDYLECYRRCLPRADYKEILAQGRAGEIDVIVTTSNEGLENFVRLCGSLNWPFSLALVVASQRGKKLASRLGFKGAIMVLDEVSNAGILKALQQWRRTAPPC